MKSLKAHFDPIIKQANESNMFIKVRVFHEIRKTRFPLLKRSDLVDITITVKIMYQDSKTYTDSIKLYADERSNKIDESKLDAFIEKTSLWIYKHKTNIWKEYEKYKEYDEYKQYKPYQEYHDKY